MQSEAYLWEHYIILPPYPADLPAEALHIYEEESAAGVPTAIARHPERGYAVLQTSGQGPYFVWRERAANDEA